MTDLKAIRTLVDATRLHTGRILGGRKRHFGFFTGREGQFSDDELNALRDQCSAAEAALERLESPTPEDCLGRNVDDYYELGRSNGFAEAREMAANTRTTPHTEDDGFCSALWKGGFEAGQESMSKAIRAMRSPAEQEGE